MSRTPFSKVLDRLDYAVGSQDKNRESILKSVLIPFSRCLNRDLSAPRQFDSPRMVVAVDAEPSVVPGQRPVFIKNRVFLGYQPKADTIEVISYNDRAGRVRISGGVGVSGRWATKSGVSQNVPCV